MPAYSNPDDALVVTFKHLALQNDAQTLKEGRPIYEDKEVCEVRVPGSRDIKVFHASEFSRWVVDPMNGQQQKQSYAERFSHQYRQFKAHAAQTKSGTPLEHVPFLTEARRAELRAQNVYTLESLADIEGAELKNLGPGGRELKNQANEFIAQSKSEAPSKALENELEALRARNTVLEEDVQILKEKAKRPQSTFEEMTVEQLRDYIATNTGQTPVGNNSHKTLVRMAQEIRPEKVA